MPEHQIRLRGAWRWKIRAGADETVRRVDLPARWPPGVESPITLIRHFGRPPADSGIDRVRLELRDVPGLVSVWLNGLEVVPDQVESGAWVVELVQPLLARNELVLDVDLHSVNGPQAEALWGIIALVIVSNAV